MIEIFSYNEVYRAYRECSKNKRHTPNAALFEIDENKKVYTLYEILNSDKYEIGKSITFLDEFPDYREIFAADFIDRIVQHLVINRLTPYFEKEFIPNSFSCRKGKGTLCGVKTLEKEAKKLSCNYTKVIYVLKCDCQHYFYSLDKRILFDKILKLIDKYNIFEPDVKDHYIKLINQIVFNCPQNNCIRKGSEEDWIKNIAPTKTLFNCDEFHGLPIGNISSQVFSNVYMNDFDHWIYDKLGFTCYGRYCDDFYILSESKEKLLEAIPKMRKYLSKINIILHPKKMYLQEFSKGVKFIGSVVKPRRTYIANRTVGRCYELMIKTYHYAQKHELTNEDIQYFVTSMNSYLGFFQHHATYNIRKKIANCKWIKPFKGKYFNFSMDYKKIKLYAKYK